MICMVTAASSSSSVGLNSSFSCCCLQYAATYTLPIPSAPAPNKVDEKDALMAALNSGDNWGTSGSLSPEDVAELMQFLAARA